MRTPQDVLNPHVWTYCWHHAGWECASEFSVADARTTSRGRAAGLFANEMGGRLPDVRVWKRYVRPWTRQDAWEYDGHERWARAHDVEDDEAPEWAPDDWEANGDGPVWEFVHRDHPDAVPVWICGAKGSPAPQNPRRRVSA